MLALNPKVRASWLALQGFPMAYLIEAAGGLCVDGQQSLLDVVPTGIHQRTPVFLGSRTDVERVSQLYKELGGST